MSDEPIIHRTSDVQSSRLGPKTTVWQYVVILKEAVVGADCNICSHVFIENDVVIGNRVTIKSGVQLWDGLRVGDDVFIGPNATFVNDLYPRSKRRPESFVETTIQNNASIGANATILCGITLGHNCMVGAGAVVTHDVPANAIVAGNPAAIVGYSNLGLKDSGVDKVAHGTPDARGKVAVRPLGVGRAALYTLPVIKDIRGRLTFAEYGDTLPFVAKRYFLISDVSNREVRGEHAHKKLEQFLVCTHGSCTVALNNGASSAEIELNSPDQALYVPPMTWTVLYHYSQDAVLLVLASDCYDEDDYIRDYDNFLQQS